MIQAREPRLSVRANDETLEQFAFQGDEQRLDDGMVKAIRMRPGTRPAHQTGSVVGKLNSGTCSVVCAIAWALQLDTHTGKRNTVGPNVLPWTLSPRMGGSTLSWQSGRRGESWRLLLVRDLLSGRQYTLVNWRAAGATPTPVKAIGPGTADGNRVVWEEIVQGSMQKTAAYLAVVSVPEQPLPTDVPQSERPSPRPAMLGQGDVDWLPILRVVHLDNPSAR